MTCHFCGTETEGGFEIATAPDGTRQRHWLSDCRPDLVKHEVGPLCTWAYRRELDVDTPERENCYGYQARINGPFTEEHIHFYEDGPC